MSLSLKGKDKNPYAGIPGAVLEQAGDAGVMKSRREESEMSPEDNRRYRLAAADYLHRPVTDTEVIHWAAKAQAAADLAAYGVLREAAERDRERSRSE